MTEPHAAWKKALRAAAACALLAGALVSTLAQHDHSLLQSGDDPSSSATSADRFLTRHDPFSRAVHWHAVLGVEHGRERDCIVCHSQRLPGLLEHKRESAPTAPVLAEATAPDPSLLGAALFPSASRAPPPLL